MEQMVQPDSEGIAVAHREDELGLRGQGQAQAPGDGVHPAVGAGEPVPFPGGEGLPAGAADRGPPDHVLDFEAQLRHGLDDDLVVGAQAAAGTGRGRGLAGAQVFGGKFA